MKRKKDYPEEKIKKINYFLGPNGPLSKKEFYEYREGQIELARLITEVLEGRGTLLAEAQTGIGKSLAYLLPSVLLGQRVVIATRTKALQDQLIKKDLPLTFEILNNEVRYVNIKGKANYLCLLLFDRLIKSPLDQLRFNPKEFYLLIEWAKTTKSGERSELLDLKEDSPIWEEVCVKDNRCLLSKCPFFKDCYLYRLRIDADKSQIIVVNHHILFADTSLKIKSFGATLLPNYNNLIIDEAHEAEDSATSFFGISISKRMIEEWIHDTFRETQKAYLEPFKNELLYETNKLLSFFENCEEKRKIKKEEIEFFLINFPSYFLKMKEFLLKSREYIESEIFKGLEERYEYLVDGLNFIFLHDDKNYVKSCEKRLKNLIFHANPINVGPILKEHLFNKMKSLILTSATLTTNDTFEYIKKRLSLNDDVFTVRIESPYDFQKQGLFFIPDIFPEPNSLDFQKCALNTIKKLLTFSKGRAFILCTSIKNMNHFYEELSKDCEYPLLLQGEKPKSQILEEFRAMKNGVLVATSSFWQGVDVQGEALSLVILDKIPFASPSEPLVESRIEELLKEGLDPFINYQIPLATIILKQGMGRLIRSKKDRGVVACLDIRLRTKSYGKMILKCLPSFPITSSLDDVKNFFESGS